MNGQARNRTWLECGYCGQLVDASGAREGDRCLANHNPTGKTQPCQGILGRDRSGDLTEAVRYVLTGNPCRFGCGVGRDDDHEAAKARLLSGRRCHE